MLLTVDIGNSHTVLGLFGGDGRLLEHWRLRSERDITADELALRIDGLLGPAGFSRERISGAVLASVVPVLEETWAGFARRYLATLHPPLLRVDADLDTGIELDLDMPAEVGADRIVNAVAAWERVGGPAIVIDFGTAVTFDCIAPPGRYVGGVIVPGIGISLDALAARTARLPRVDVSRAPERAMGRNTVEAIHSGILRGFGGLADRLCEDLGRELCPEGGAPAVLATGGMAGVIAPYSRRIQQVEPMLTLEGLALIHARVHGSQARQRGASC